MGKYITEWRNIQKSKEEIFKLVKPNAVICIFDTETTGVTDKAKIIQFSGAKYRVLPDYRLEKLSEPKNLYINPKEHIPEKATAVNRITDEMVADKPIEKYVAPIIYQYLDYECDIWCGYNIEFDIKMVDNMRLRTQEWPCSKPSIDVNEMARDFVSLDETKEFNLAKIYKLKYPDRDLGFHDSNEDIIATKELLELFLSQYISYVPPTDKKPIRLEKAHVFVNPHQKSQQRIAMVLSEGEDGDVYYDVRYHRWRCKTTTAAKRLFSSIDLYDLEKQFLNKYAYPFDLKNMDDVGKRWLKYRREINK